PGSRLDFVIRKKRSIPLHEVGIVGPEMDPRQSLTGPVEEVGVIGDITDDGGARSEELVVPLGLDGANELNQVQSLAVEWGDRLAQRPNLGPCGVQSTGVESDQVLVLLWIYGRVGSDFTQQTRR